MEKPIRIGLVGLGRAGHGMHKKELETRIARCLEAGNCDEAQELCDKLAETIEQMQRV